MLDHVANPFLHTGLSMSGTQDTALRRPAAREATSDAQLVREIHTLVDSTADAEIFFREMLKHVVQALKAVGGAVWLLDALQRPGLQCEMGLREVMPGGADEVAQHATLLQRAMSGGPMLPVPPHKGVEDDGQCGNPSDFLLLFGQLKAEGNVLGVIEVFALPGGGASEELAAQRLLQQACDMAAKFLGLHQVRQFFEHKALWSRLNQYTESVHRGLDSKTVAYTLVNEGRRLIECDRVSLAVKVGRAWRIKAVSGQDSFDKRSNLIRLLNNLATKVASMDEPLWYTGDAQDLAPQVETAIHEYVDESHSKLVAVVPMYEPLPPETPGVDRPTTMTIGVLIVEMIGGVGAVGLRERTGLVAQHGTVALANSVEHESLLFLPLWRAVSKTRWLVQARTLPKTLLAVAFVAAVMGGLFLIPKDFEIESKGTLEPVEKREVFAPHDGVVESVSAEHGKVIAAGTPLLTMTNTDVNVTLVDTKGKLSSANEQLRSLEQQRSQIHLTPDEREKLGGQAAQLHATRRSLERQVEMLTAKQGQLQINSPINGQVVTWQPRDRLIHRPVQRGQSLLTVANPKGEWQLELHVPEDRMGHVATAQGNLPAGEQLPVRYIVATNPRENRAGTVQEIHTTAEVHGDEGNSILVKVQINKDDLTAGELHPGATVTAKIHCGRASLGYCWFHDLIGYFQRMWFKVF